MLSLFIAGVITACASSGNKLDGNGGSGGTGGSSSGGSSGAGGVSGSGNSGGSGGSSGAAAADAGGDTGLPDTGSDATPPDASSDTGSDAVQCSASLGQQCGTAVACAPGDRCGSLYNGPGVRDWPVDTDATGPAADGGGPTCVDSNQKNWPSEGVGSATWYKWGNCGSYKTFPVSAGCAFDILSYNDCCPGCVLNDVNIEVQEMVGGVWTTQTTITHAYSSGVCDHWDDTYVPQTSQVRLLYSGSQGFYVCVFQE